MSRRQRLVMLGSAFRGDLQVMQEAGRELSGQGWQDSAIALAAARGGHLEVLQWAVEHGCPWHKEATYEAAGGGHLEELQWAVEHECPWDEWTTYAAAGGGHLEVLQWAVEHGCPWHVRTNLAADDGGDEAMIQWVAENAPRFQRM